LPSCSIRRNHENHHRYCENCDIAAIVSRSDVAAGGVRPYAIDPAAADRLWAMSAEMIDSTRFGRDLREQAA
jgi:hypothetical protein